VSVSMPIRGMQRPPCGFWDGSASAHRMHDTKRGHFGLWTRADGDLGRWVHWLLTTHMRRSLCHHGYCDRDWQGNSGP